MNGRAWFWVIVLCTVAVMLRRLSMRNLRCHWCGVRLQAWEHPENPCDSCRRLKSS